MDVQTQVAVVSIYGRGHWLASELARSGVPTVLLDISQQMGIWAPEDWEGPFGLFQTETLQPSQMERILEEDSPLMVSQGLTFWLSTGPLEMKGPTIKHRLDAMKVGEVTLRYLTGNASASELKREEFVNSWLAHFSHHWTSPQHALNPEGVTIGKRTPLFSNFFVRQATRAGFEKNLRWCEAQKVQVPKVEKTSDLFMKDRSRVEGLEVTTTNTGVLKAEQFVWCMTSEETCHLSPQISKRLFPKGGVSTQWSWIRYRVRMKGLSTSSTMMKDQIPLHAILVGDEFLPWTHENVVVLQRAGSHDIFDAWIRIPTEQRFQKQYLQERGEKIIELIMKRLPEHEVLVQEYPQEASYTFEQIGPPRYGVYSRALDRELKVKSFENVFWNSPEVWNSYTWESQFEHQTQIVDELKTWWKKKEEARIKREQKEAMKRNEQ